MMARRAAGMTICLVTAAFVGCEDVRTDPGQRERREAVAEEQEQRERDASLREAEHAERDPAAGPRLADPTIPTITVPNVDENGQIHPADGVEAADDGPVLAPAHAAHGPEPAAAPSEGDPDAGTESPPEA
jgi:hypothetical protein